MNTPGSSGSGNSSDYRQENGDQTMDSERPLKKARFAWQVKGKHHLKHDTLKNNKASDNLSDEPEIPESSSESDTSDVAHCTKDKLEKLDNILKKDIDSFKTTSAKTLHPITSISKKKLKYPKHVNTFHKLCKCSVNSTIPSSMVSYTYSEDQCILIWQERQLAKGFVDNTINHVLDSWLVGHTPAEVEANKSLAIDVADFINNLPEDNSIENEGILMAISAHGLQNTSSSSSCNKEDLCPLTSDNELDPELSNLLLGFGSDLRPSRTNNVRNPEEFIDLPSEDEFGEIPSPPSPLPDDDDDNDGDEDDDNSQGFWEDDFCRDIDIELATMSEEAMRQNVADLTHLALFPDGSNQNFNEDGNRQTVNRNNERLRNNDINNHFDFLDAAVSFAIQNRGLTSYGTYYG
ncbi:unnamed protein product [Parnassius apollo]|uniref:(apollo) hypothetical protein n=1 Tax=Parnassius apollo TaxID=110799 RepID=A0A8S3W6I0_PARAO|nr:unnamed protein product [Parnassius apollo]